MPSAILAKNWNIDANLRNAYVSLADMTGWFLFENKRAMKVANWTVKFSSDGVTGPSSGADTTDRWITKANASVRGTAAATVQSWIVMESVDGVQVLFAFQGATDDIARISFSANSGFTLAGTTTHQPTATDEIVISAGNSVVSSATPGDRVMTIWCTTDGTQWSSICFRAGSLNQFIGVERVNSFCGAGVFDRPYVGYRHIAFNRTNNPAASNPQIAGTVGDGSFVIGSAGWRGTLARVFTAGAFRTIRVGGGFINITHIADGFTRTFNNLDDSMNSHTPALQGSRGTPLTPLYWCGEKAANVDGVLGSPIDWWLSYSALNSAVPALGTFMPGYQPGEVPGVDPERTNWLVCLGANCIRPWKNSSPVFRTI